MGSERKYGTVEWQFGHKDVDDAMSKGQITSKG